ncbi:MAG: hypothetical protein AB9903_14140 [Vulcanimicrobiota bacterium]
MHNNLVKVQESMIQCIAEVLEILEVRNVKPLIIAALKISEKPLTVDELHTRTKLDTAAISKILDDLSDSGIVSKTSREGIECFDLADRAGRKFMEVVHSKAKAVMHCIRTRLDESGKLMTEGRNEFSEYDSLMARFLNEKLHKAEVIAQILKRKVFFFDFLESHKEESDSVKRIPVE